MSIEELRTRIADIQQVSANMISLMYNDKPMDLSSQVSDYNIKEGSVIEVGPVTLEGGSA